MQMTLDELRARQKWSFDQKLDHAVATVETFLNRVGPAFVSFSGGKDSTVLLDLCRRFISKDFPAVFCNTGAEYPDVVKFVHSIECVTVIKPTLTFREVLETRGFPLVSKEQSRYIRQARHTKSEHLRQKRLGIIEPEKRLGQIYKCWQYLVNAPYDCSEECCEILKKRPFRKYCKASGQRPIIATTCDESSIRSEAYIRRGGCNSFEKNKEASYPLSIWTDKDIWEYVDKFNLRLCDLYKKGFKRTGCMCCGFGAHHDNRIIKFAETCPNVAKKILTYENHGTKYIDALRAACVAVPNVEQL